MPVDERPDDQTVVWFDIDLEVVERYEVWKPESLKWALTVDWARVDDLVRNNLADYPAMNHGSALRAAEASGACSPADLFGLSSLYAEPIFATPFQVTAGGHRITAMREQGLQ